MLFESSLTHLLRYFDTAIVSIKRLQEVRRHANGSLSAASAAGIPVRTGQRRCPAFECLDGNARQHQCYVWPGYVDRDCCRHPESMGRAGRGKDALLNDPVD